MRVHTNISMIITCERILLPGEEKKKENQIISCVFISPFLLFLFCGFSYKQETINLVFAKSKDGKSFSFINESKEEKKFKKLSSFFLR